MEQVVKSRSHLTDIKPNPVNSEIYSQSDLSDLRLSLETIKKWRSGRPRYNE